MQREPSQNKIIVVHYDDNPYELEAVESALKNESFGPHFIVQSCLTPDTLIEALDRLDKVDVVILDIHDENLGTDAGFDLATKVRSHSPQSIIVMRSSSTDPKSVLKSLQRGADDFISKRTDQAELSLRIYNAMQLGRSKRGLNSSASTAPTGKPGSYAGDTMARIAARIPKIINSAITAVHVYGEPGTGKEVVADLFRASLLASKPFVKVNCGAISPSLLESELFGHVKGSFTGASTDRKGLIEEAHGGWIFLDEVATLPTAAQVALLRVLENKEIKPIGGSKTKTVDVRIISAANEKLEELVQKDRFRKDLWQRLIETAITIPPLRERREETPTLIDAICKTLTGGPYEITGATKDALAILPWSDGNVRELRNCLRAMTEYSEDHVLTPLSIPARYWTQETSTSKATSQSSITIDPSIASGGPLRSLTINWDTSAEGSFELAVDELLCQLLNVLYNQHQRLTVRSVAKFTGIAKTTLAEKLRKLVDRGLLSSQDLQRMVGLESSPK